MNTNCSESAGINQTWTNFRGRLNKSFFSRIAWLQLIFALAVLGACSPLPKVSGTSSIQDQILDLDKKLQEARASDNLPFLENALAEDFVYTHELMDGKQEDKAAYLAAITRSPGHYFYRHVDSSTVEIHGDMAIVTGVVSIKRKPNALRNEKGNQCFTQSYFHVYEKRKRKWLFISHRVAAASRPSPCE